MQASGARLGTISASGRREWGFQDVVTNISPTGFTYHAQPPNPPSPSLGRGAPRLSSSSSPASWTASQRTKWATRFSAISYSRWYPHSYSAYAFFCSPFRRSSPLSSHADPASRPTRARRWGPSGWGFQGLFYMGECLGVSGVSYSAPQEGDVSVPEAPGAESPDLACDGRHHVRSPRRPGTLHPKP